jgi:uncharacterized RDD family membrane protein YckC
MSTSAASGFWESDMWWRRGIGLVIDFVPVAVTIEVLLYVMGYRSVLAAGTKPQADATTVIGVVSIGIYFACVMKLTGGRTLGKWILGTRVTRDDGNRLPLWQIVWREAIVKVVLLAALVALGGIAGLVGFLIIAIDLLWARWDSHLRPLHDVLAGTQVIKLR